MQQDYRRNATGRSSPGKLDQWFNASVPLAFYTDASCLKKLKRPCCSCISSMIRMLWNQCFLWDLWLFDRRRWVVTSGAWDCSSLFNRERSGLGSRRCMCRDREMRARHWKDRTSRISSVLSISRRELFGFESLSDAWPVSRTSCWMTRWPRWDSRRSLTSSLGNNVQFTLFSTVVYPVARYLEILFVQTRSIYQNPVITYPSAGPLGISGIHCTRTQKTTTLIMTTIKNFRPPSINFLWDFPRILRHHRFCWA